MICFAVLEILEWVGLRLRSSFKRVFRFLLGWWLLFKFRDTFTFWRYLFHIGLLSGRKHLACDFLHHVKRFIWIRYRHWLRLLSNSSLIISKYNVMYVGILEASPILLPLGTGDGERLGILYFGDGFVGVVLKLGLTYLF